MIAGLPGTGIGGMFYVLSAIVLTVRSAIDRLLGRGDPLRQRSAWLLGGMTAVILAGVFTTGLLLGLILVPYSGVSGHHALAATGGLAWLSSDRNVVRMGAFVLSVVTLIAVLLGVELLRFAYPGPGAGAKGTPGMKLDVDKTLC